MRRSSYRINRLCLNSFCWMIILKLFSILQGHVACTCGLRRQIIRICDIFCCCVGMVQYLNKRKIQNFYEISKKYINKYTIRCKWDFLNHFYSSISIYFCSSFSQHQMHIVVHSPYLNMLHWGGKSCSNFCKLHKQKLLNSTQGIFKICSTKLNKNLISFLKIQVWFFNIC